MDSKIWLIIGGMALVTAIPRLLPYYILNKAALTEPVRQWLKLLPTVIFASMITPPLLVEGNSLAPTAHVTDIVTVLATGIIAYYTRNIALSLAGAITVLLVMQYLL